MTGIPSWAVRGAKVVCVKDFATAQRVNDLGHRTMPVQREVYELDAVEDWPQYGAIAVFLVGFPRNQGFDIRGFKPVTPHSTEDEDVGLFRHHLDQRVPEKA